MMRYFFYTIIGIFLLSCTSNKNKKIDNVDKVNSDYPSIIDSLGLQEIYDNTKWQLYLLRVLDTPKYDDQFNHSKYVFDSSISYSKMDLKFDSLYMDDTGCVKLYFEFYLNDTLPVTPWKFRDLKGYYNGMKYNLKNSSDTIQIIYLDKFRSNHFSEWGFHIPNKFMIDTSTDITINPLQPDVIKFLNENKTQLHPWLYKEGVKRGVIKE